MRRLRRRVGGKERQRERVNEADVNKEIHDVGEIQVYDASHCGIVSRDALCA